MANLWHEFKYYLINILRSKSMLFYTLALPMILAGMYYLATTSLTSPELVVETAGLTDDEVLIEYEEIFADIEPFDLVVMSEEEGIQALEAGEIVGYINADEALIITENSVSTSILKMIMDEIQQVYALGPAAANVNFDRNFILENEIPATFVTIMFYGLIGMVSLYGAFRGVEISNEIYASMSPFAARLNTTPLRKYSYIGLNYLLALILTFFSTSMVIVFLELVLDFQLIQDYGISFLLILCMNILGISFGMLCGLIPKLSESAKINVALMFILVLSMFAGGMTPSLPQVIYSTAPWLMKINPVSTFTENFYRVNLLNDYSTLQGGALYLILLATIFTVFVMVYLRGKKYEYV